jgi:hypothetical protein
MKKIPLNTKLSNATLKKLLRDKIWLRAGHPDVQNRIYGLLQNRKRTAR